MLLELVGLEQQYMKKSKKNNCYVLLFVFNALNVLFVLMWGTKVILVASRVLGATMGLYLMLIGRKCYDYANIQFISDPICICFTYKGCLCHGSVKRAYGHHGRIKMVDPSNCWPRWSSWTRWPNGSSGSNGPSWTKWIQLTHLM